MSFLEQSHPTIKRVIAFTPTYPIWIFKTPQVWQRCNGRG